MKDRIAALSIDLDEIGCYHRIHGLPTPEGAAATAVWDRALERHLALCDTLGIRATFFVVGEDLAREENARRLRAVVEAGHEVGNHTRSHPYALVRMGKDEIRREVVGGMDAIERACGVRPAGFRAPGYNMSAAVFEVLEEGGAAWDSSLLASAPYYVAKAAVMAAMRLSGRRSQSVLGDPRALLSRAAPHRRGGIVEIPIGTVPGTGIPFIGTTITLAGTRGARLLARAMGARRLVNLELHGIDLADADADGLGRLARHQPDLRRPLASREAALRAALQTLLDRGRRFVPLGDALSLAGGVQV